MKSKTFDKKLILHKKTIACLNKAEMGNVNGRVDNPSWGEHSCPNTVCLSIWPIHCR
jgi:hypothetical protein